MSLTVQQLLSDAKRLSSRLRDHDQSADHLISRAQEVLKEVDAMRQYQEDVENLNEVAHNRPRAQLVLGIQQENRHIRTLQQENKELRAALEEHQNALELIMSKYRQHVTRLVNTPHPDIQYINNQKIQMLAERTEKVCEMAAVMKEAVRVDEEACNQQQELMARLITENKGLRELLEISQKNSPRVPKVKKVVSNVNKEVQTDSVSTVVEQVVSVTLPMPAQPKPPPRSPKHGKEIKVKVEQSEPIDHTDNLEIGVGELSSGDSDETGSEDESVKFDTIKLADRRNKDAAKAKDKIKATDPGEPTESCLEKLVVKSEVEAEVVEAIKAEVSAPVPSIDEQSIDIEDEMVKHSNDEVSDVEPARTDESLRPLPKTELTEGQKNVVLVDSLVEQLVHDSVETSTSAGTEAADLKSDSNIPAETRDSPAKTEPEPVVAAAGIAPVKPTSGQAKNMQEQASKTSTPSTPSTSSTPSTPTPTSSSSQQPTKSARAEPGHSRSNSKGKNKKNADKGNKNSPKKGNKK
jgi:hypothetical protein